MLAAQGGAGAALADLPHAALVDEQGRNLYRRRLVVPAIREGRFDDAVALLERLTRLEDAPAKDFATLASVLMRAGRRAEGLTQLDAAGERDPDNLAIAAQRLQGRLQSGRLEEAATLARRYASQCAATPRLALFVMLAFVRGGDPEEAARVAALVSDQPDQSAEALAVAAEALADTGRPQAALDVCEKALARGLTSAALHLCAARAILAIHGEEAHALRHLDAARALEPENLQALKTAGEMLLGFGRAHEAAELLTRARSLAPKAQTVGLLTARALKHARRYNEAADVMRDLVAAGDRSPAMRRFAASALLQAGRGQEAREIYESFVAERREALRGSFSEALASLRDDLSQARIPQARLDFAWSIANSRMDRSQWDAGARWGLLADLLLLDWLECAPERAGEIVELIETETEGADPVREAHAAGAGVLLLGAHIGPLYAGPLAVHLSGMRYKWLASAPTIMSAPHAGSLISTSDRNEEDVGKAVIVALREGACVMMALDGAMSPAAPSVNWRGRRATYSDFAARLVYRRNIPAFFAASFWRAGKIAQCVEPMPQPLPGEEIRAFETRWREVYFAQIEKQILRGPENMRLAGGVWRKIG